MNPCVEISRSWWQWHPPVGWCVALVGVVGVLVPWLRGESIKPRERAFWTIVMVGLTLMELWSIHRDGKERDAEQAFTRCEERQSFEGIVKGLEAGVKTSKGQYASTITHVDGVLTTTQKVADLTQNTLQKLTGGDSFANVTPQTGLNELPIPLSIFNNGKHILTGVTVTFRKGLIEADNPSPWSNLGGPQIQVGTLAPNELRVLPFTISPHLGKSGFDVFVLTISAQNYSVDEWLSFRKGQTSMYAYKEKVIHNYPSSRVGKVIKYRNDVLIDRDWSDGPKEDSPK